MRLPDLPYAMRKNAKEIVAMRGLNLGDNTQDGDMADCRNISARRYPYITTRRARERQKKPGGGDYAGGTALTAWGKLVAVEGTNLLYDGQVVGQVTAGAKQFAVVNTKMVIWPDKKYLDMDSRELKALGAAVTATRAVFTTGDVTLTGAGDLTAVFKTGDALTVTGCTEAANNKDIVVKAVTANKLTVAANTFTAKTESGSIKFERKVPDMDFICESENRLWGCSNKERTIYASSLGDPTNFYVYEGLATDAYALAVGSEGDFTGCCKLTSSVLFWKETKLHKILGGYPAEYSLYTYDIEGLQSGCHKSLQIINEVLFYMGLHGIYAFSGGTPSLISGNFGDRRFTDAVAGNDGDSYYLSVKEGGVHHFLVYETGAGIWVREDDTAAVDFARVGRDLYFMDSGGSVYLADSGKDDPSMEWLARFTPFYETIQGRKRYSKLLLRLELPKGSWLEAEARMDGGDWRSCGRAVGRDSDVTALQITPHRCDKFEIRLRGRGPCTILSLLREFSVGSDA